uniref:Uncharacterized protein n=1 Tax=Euplotes harpa TaxID=151035 RepID=A0A7S3J798_9SPIT|mmetsp:Transcript_23893/g.27513  ORF Transcript_23893/g.27513 Transcript_23893/m.27513 type:complete len:254 (+) Transcript_23893:179-940(+)
MDSAITSKTLQRKYMIRRRKLPNYTNLVDILSMKGEDVSEMRACIDLIPLNKEELKKGDVVFENIANAMATLDYMRVMQFSSELQELEAIDSEKERQLHKLETLLRSFDKHYEIREAFSNVPQTPPTATVDPQLELQKTPGLSQASAHPIGAPHVPVPVPVQVPVPSTQAAAEVHAPEPVHVPVPVPAPAQVHAPAHVAAPAPDQSLEERMRSLELQNALMKAEFELFKAQHAVQYHALENLVKQMHSQLHHS